MLWFILFPPTPGRMIRLLRADVRAHAGKMRAGPTAIYTVDVMHEKRSHSEEWNLSRRNRHPALYEVRSGGAGTEKPGQAWGMLQLGAWRDEHMADS